SIAIVEASEQIQVSLCHKPRGCKGVWQKVEAKSALRVTKGKGKWLKLEVTSRLQFKAADVDVFLLDVSAGSPFKLLHTPDEGIVIESITDSGTAEKYSADIELKLDRVCKKLQFWVAVKGPFGILNGKSVD